MTTGDIKNNLRKLQSEVRQIKYTEHIDVTNLSKGVPTAFLPIYHYAFTQYSIPITEKIASMDIELFGKSDLRFMEAVYKILRDLFHYKPLVTKDQFFSAGFAERKVIMSTEVLSLLRAKKKELEPTSKSTSNLRSSSSMESLNKNASQLRTKSAENRRVSMIETSKGQKMAKESLGRTSRTVGLTRPTSAPQGRQPKAHSIQHKPPVKKETSIRVATDNQSYSGTSSIMRGRPAAVEIVRLPRDGESASSQISTIKSSQQTVEIPTDLHYKLDQISELFKLTDEIKTRITCLETQTKISSPVGNSTMIHPVEPPPLSADIMAELTQIKQQQETILSRLILQENRHAMLEAKVDSLMSESEANNPPPYNCDSPASTVKNSNKGAFVSVESVVHGGKLVKKLQISPEKPLKINSNENTNSPPIRALTPDMEAEIVDVLPSGSSTPVTSDCEVNPCHFIDESTQHRVDRIKNLFNETDGMLKNIGVVNALVTSNNQNQQAKDLDADVDEKELEQIN
ncbi:centrosomal protein of 44 kDa [Patella vulgata]|uniref:centrosomal protein of 44 kDa n=1 Tax=Patella vulgata TaxID=6465 RepID=UPI0024A8CEAF|nr:centrosomal protein of 44 kDa [Patella vulgata]XP_050391679.2 centrosomal protein of 44 kDa [Patella vulgata]